MDSNLDRVIDEAIDEAIFPDDLLFDFLDKEIAEKMRRNPNYNLINLRLDIAGYLHQFELLDKTSKEALFDLKNQNFLERLGQVFDDIKAIATKRPKINLDPQKERLERLVKEIQRSIKTVRVDRIEKEVFARVLAENPNLSYPELGDIYTLEINAVLEEAKRAEVEAKKKAEVAERKAAQAEGKVKTLQEELEKIKTEKAGLQVKVGQITEELNQTKTTLENALSSSSELNQKLTNKSKNLERANQEIDKLKTEKASLESGVAEIKKELDQAKITLENSVSDADSLTNNLKVQLRSKEQKLNKKGRELVKATEKSMELSEELEKIKVEKADLQGKLGQIAEELNQTKTVLENTLSSSININSNLEKQLAEKNQAIESKHRSLEELRQELKELGEEKDILQNKVVEIKEELDQAKTTLENSVSVADNLTNDLKMQLRLKEQELYEKLEESIRAALEFNKLSEELEELKAEKADLEGILEEIAKELSLTQELLISESQAKKAVTKELAQAQENIVNLTNLNSTLETKLITLIDELERLKGKLEATYNYCLNLVVAVRNFDSGFNFRLKPLESYTEKLLDSVKGQLENLYCDLVFESAAQIIRSAPRSYQNRYLLLESDSGISFEYNGELCSVRRNELNCEIAQEIDNYFRWHGQNLETYIEPPPQRKYQQEYPVRGWELE